MGFSVNRGEPTTNGYQPPTEAPAVEAEVPEEEMFATYYEPEIEEEISPRPQPQPETEQPGNPIQLRSFIPDTSEDYKVGYRTLREHEFKALGIPKDRSDRKLYRTRELASKNVFKISADRVGEHLKELQVFKFPPNYLWDKDGMTPECVWELKRKIRHTAFWIYPAEDLSKYKRGDFMKVRIQNPDYNSATEYWKEIVKRSSDYENWLNHEKEDNPEPEIHDAEWVFGNEKPEERDERLSIERSEIELIEHQIYQSFKDRFGQLRKNLVRIAEDEGIQTRKESDERFMKVALNPELTEETEEDEEDL